MTTRLRRFRVSRFVSSARRAEREAGKFVGVRTVLSRLTEKWIIDSSRKPPSFLPQPFLPPARQVNEGATNGDGRSDSSRGVLLPSTVTHISRRWREPVSDFYRSTVVREDARRASACRCCKPLGAMRLAREITGIAVGEPGSYNDATLSRNTGLGDGLKTGTTPGRPTGL